MNIEASYWSKKKNISILRNDDLEKMAITAVVDKTTLIKSHSFLEGYSWAKGHHKFCIANE